MLSLRPPSLAALDAKLGRNFRSNRVRFNSPSRCWSRHKFRSQNGPAEGSPRDGHVPLASYGVPPRSGRCPGSPAFLLHLPMEVHVSEPKALLVRLPLAFTIRHHWGNSLRAFVLWWSLRNLGLRNPSNSEIVAVHDGG